MFNAFLSKSGANYYLPIAGIIDQRRNIASGYWRHTQKIFSKRDSFIIVNRAISIFDNR